MADSSGPSPADLYNYLIARGANTNEALMLTSAAHSESGLDPTKTHDGGIGYGMWGHNGSRLQGMQAYAQQSGQSLGDWTTQADYALNELRSRPESAAVNAAKSPTDLATAQMYYEQPAGFTPQNPTAGKNYAGRLATIQNFSGLATPGGTVSSGPSTAITPATPSGAGGAPASNAVIQQLLAAANGQGGAGGAGATGSPGLGQSPGAALLAGLKGGGLGGLMAQARGATPQNASSTPLVAQLIGKITNPLHTALSAAIQGNPPAPGAGGAAPSGAVPGASSGFPPAAGAPGVPQAPLNPANNGQPVDVPLPPSRPADVGIDPAAAAAPAPGPQASATDPSALASAGDGGGLLNALAGMFG